MRRAFNTKVGDSIEEEYCNVAVKLSGNTGPGTDR